MKIAFIYSGQGSQYIGMGKSFYETNELFKNHLDLASKILQESLTEIMFEQEELLNDTVYSQPAIYTLSTGIKKMLEADGVVADVTAGLSLGEYAALYDAGVYSFEEGLRILIHRAYFMNRSIEANPGKMVALMGDQERAIALCESIEGCFIANLNSATQTVVGGSLKVMEDIIAKAKEHKQKRAVLLNTQGAFHTPLMQMASDDFAMYLKYTKFHDVSKPLYLNTTAKKYQGEDLKELLPKQMTHTVRFYDMLETMQRDGVDVFIELGPKDTLKKLIQKQLKDVTVLHIEDVDSYHEVLKKIKELKDEI